MKKKILPPLSKKKGQLRGSSITLLDFTHTKIGCPEHSNIALCVRNPSKEDVAQLLKHFAIGTELNTVSNGV